MARGTLTQLYEAKPEALGALRVSISSVFLLSAIFTSFSNLGRLPVTLLRPTGLMRIFPWGFYDQLFTPAGITTLKSALVFSLALSAAGFLSSV